MHVSHIEEPGSKYFGHLALQIGSANAIANGIFDYMSADHLELDAMALLLVNAGAEGGAIRLIELELNKSVHWFVCQLHADELPIRHPSEA